MSILGKFNQSLRRSIFAESNQFKLAWSKIDGVEGWLSQSEAELLFTCASNSASRNVIEIGSYKGRSTTALALGSQVNGQVFAIDPHTGDKTQVNAGLQIDTFNEFIENMNRLGLKQRVTSVRLTSQEAFVANNYAEVGVVFIDGWHDTDEVFHDISESAQFCTSLHTILIDDFHQKQVEAGILKAMRFLPPPILSVGKIVMFSNDTHLLRSKEFRTYYNRHRQLNLRLSKFKTK